MTDAPGPYQQVNVDVMGVEITGDGGQSVTLNVVPGIYDLLKLSNGVEKLIATDTLEISKVQQIRLILGTRNSGTRRTYPLSTKCRAVRLETSGKPNITGRYNVSCT
jgi:hypothetical protein